MGVVVNSSKSLLKLLERAMGKGTNHAMSAFFYHPRHFGKYDPGIACPLQHQGGKHTVKRPVSKRQGMGIGINHLLAACLCLYAHAVSNVAGGNLPAKILLRDFFRQHPCSAANISDKSACLPVTMGIADAVAERHLLKGCLSIIPCGGTAKMGFKRLVIEPLIRHRHVPVSVASPHPDHASGGHVRSLSAPPVLPWE